MDLTTRIGAAAAVLLSALGTHPAAGTTGSTRVGILNGSGEAFRISVQKPADAPCGDGNARIWSRLLEETHPWALTDEAGWPLSEPPHRVVPEGSRIVFWMEFQEQPDESCPAVYDNCKLLVRTGSGQHFTLIFTAGAIWTGEGTIEEEANLGVHDPGTWQPGQLDQVLRYFPSCSTTSLVFGTWPPPSWPTGPRARTMDTKNAPAGLAPLAPLNASLSKESLSAGSTTSDSVSPSTSRESLASNPGSPDTLTASASKESVRSEDRDAVDADSSTPARTILTPPGDLEPLPPAAL